MHFVGSDIDAQYVWRSHDKVMKCRHTLRQMMQVIEALSCGTLIQMQGGGRAEDDAVDKVLPGAALEATGVLLRQGVVLMKCV